MKKITVCALASLGVLLLAVPGSAGTPPGVVQPQPRVMTLETYKVVSVGRGPDDGAGNFTIDVGVENLTAASRSAKVWMGGSAATWDIPAKTVKHFVLTDPGEGPPSCGLSPTKEYDFSLSDAAGPNASFHKVILRANNCSFSTGVVQPWNQIEPDHVVSLTANTIYVQNVTVETAQTCSATLKLKVSIVNHTNVAQNGIKVVLKEGSVVNGSATVNVAKGGSATATIVAATPVHWAGIVSLEGATSVAASGDIASVKPTCTYTAEIDPAAQPAAAIPR
jgi:hypothetical protein